MQEPPQGLVQMLDSMFGGAATALIGATIGRLMWHSSEVRAKRRSLFGRELIWDIPIVIGMGIIGEGVADYWNFSQPISTSIIAVLSYLGPRGAEVLLERWFAKGKDPK